MGDRAGGDARPVARRIRENGMPHGVIAHNSKGEFDLEALVAQARAWTGLVGLDLAKDASCLQPFVYGEGLWSWPEGYAPPQEPPRYEVVALGFGGEANHPARAPRPGPPGARGPRLDHRRGGPGAQS